MSLILTKRDKQVERLPMGRNIQRDRTPQKDENLGEPAVEQDGTRQVKILAP